MCVLTFETLPPDHVVLRLLDDGLVPSVFLTDANGSDDALGGPFGGTPVESLALLNYVVESSASLLQRGFIVGAMAEHDVNVLQLESLKRIVQTFNNVLTGSEPVVHTVTTREDLGRNHEVFSS